VNVPHKKNKTQLTRKTISREKRRC